MAPPNSGKIDLKGQAALVTGSARGIGRGIALALAREGADLCLSDLIDTRETASAVRSLGRRAIENRCDVSRKDNVISMVDQAIREFGKIDILISCAAICHRTHIKDLSEEEWDNELAVNLKGTFLVVQAVLPHMKERNYGKIICLGSVAGKVGGLISGPHYVASKGAIHAFIKWVAKDAAAHSIYVNGIAPGPVETEMTKGFPYSAGMVTLKRLGTTEDIAEAALFLSSQASNWITGMVLDVNGGMTMN